MTQGETSNSAKLRFATGRFQCVAARPNKVKAKKNHTTIVFSIVHIITLMLVGINAGDFIFIVFKKLLTITLCMSAWI